MSDSDLQGTESGSAASSSSKPARKAFVKWPPIKFARKPKGIVWKYFLEKRRKPDEANPESLYWMCVFCDAVYTNKHATRLAKHILNCGKSPEDAKVAIRKSSASVSRKGSTNSKKGLDSDKESEDSDMDCEEVDSPAIQSQTNNNHSNDDGASSSLPNLSSSSVSLRSDSIDSESGLSFSSRCSTPRSSSSFQGPEKIGGLYKFMESMSSNEQFVLNQLFARAVYSSGIPFQTIAENQEWQKFFKRLRPSFRLPHRKQLAGALLNDEFDHVQQAVNEKLAESTVLCLQCDGWSNRRNEAIINFIINTPEPVFYKTLETKLERHSADYFFQEMELIFQKIGPHKFEAVITDNASAMIKCTSKVNEKYPHISAYTCASHSINLLVQDILKLKCVEEVTSNCLKIVRAVTRSQILKAAFISIQEKENTNNVLTLLFPVKTRWTSWRNCMHNLKKTSYALKLLCINDDTKHLLSPDLRELILSEAFWNKIDIVSNLIDIAVAWTVKLQDDKPCISSVFKAFVEIETTMKQKLSSSEVRCVFSEADCKKIEEILSKRNKKSLKPIHLASYLLDPQYRGKYFTPDQDIEAMQFIDAKIRQLFSDPNDVLETLSELANYKYESELFSKTFVKDAAKKVPALTWWKGVCSSTRLHRVAEKILSLPATTAATERSFSIQGFIHNAKRNRLKAESAGKVTFVNYNLKLEQPKGKRAPNPNPSTPESLSDGEETDASESSDDWSHLAIEMEEELEDGNLNELDIDRMILECEIDEAVK